MSCVDRRRAEDGGPPTRAQLPEYRLHEDDEKDLADGGEPSDSSRPSPGHLACGTADSP